MATRHSNGRRTLTDGEFHDIARALADRRRFAILEQIAASESVACSCLREQAAIGAATVSHHLKELSEAGLVAVERQGRTAQITLRRNVWDAYLERLGRL